MQTHSFIASLIQIPGLLVVLDRSIVGFRFKMRGGGGGRGGRGGRWFGKPSVTHDLIRDNLEDLGLDQYAVVDDKRPPELYPAAKLPGVPPLYDNDIATTHKSMYLLHRYTSL